jgi:hypothetical protein
MMGFCCLGQLVGFEPRCFGSFKRDSNLAQFALQVVALAQCSSELY